MTRSAWRAPSPRVAESGTLFDALAVVRRASLWSASFGFAGSRSDFVEAALILALAFGFGYGPHWVIRPDALVPLALVILDGLAYGLVMTALVLRGPPIGAIVHVFNMATGFFGGMFIPITIFPHDVEIAARFLPTALGTEVLNATLDGRGLGAAWADGTLPWLLVHVVVLAGPGPRHSGVASG